MSELKLLTVGGLADRLATITGNSVAFHARQLRGQIRGEALNPVTYGGEGVTAAALFDEAGLCRAMVLHTLASLNLDSALLKSANGLTKNLDERARTAGVVQPADAMAFAVKKIREGVPMYLRLGFPAYPYDEAVGELTGCITGTPEIEDSPIIPKRAWIVLPLHTILSPLLGVK